jgi:hypothetical protein
MALAVEHLREELARNDQALYESLAVEWSALVQAPVLIDEALELRATTADGTRLAVEADAHVLRDPLALVVRAPGVAGTSPGGGQAIASLFGGDRQKVAWAWASMWQMAEAGQESTRVVLSRDQKVEVKGTEALLRLKGQVSDRRATHRDAQSRTGPGQPPRQPGEVIVRRLKDITRLRPDGGSLVNAGKAKQGIRFPPPADPDFRSKNDSASGRRDDGHSRDQGRPDSKGQLASKTVPAPVDDREQLAFDAVRMALALAPQEIQDLRARRGAGGDAMDDLGQLFEIKMSSGSGDNEVTLRKSQAEAARDPDFFLAVVDGLDEGDTTLSVRFIFDPLRRLEVRVSGDLTLAGVREVEALEFKFSKVDDNPGHVDGPSRRRLTR